MCTESVSGPGCRVYCVYHTQDSLPLADTLGCVSSSGTSSPPPPGKTRAHVGDVPFSDLYYDSEDEDEDEMGQADPVQDDLYTRKIGLLLQSSINESYNKFLPKFWTPEEDAHVRRIKLGSQSRPWYRKMQGFRCVWGRSPSANFPVTLLSSVLFHLVFIHFNGW